MSYPGRSLLCHGNPCGVKWLNVEKSALTAGEKSAEGIVGRGYEPRPSGEDSPC